MIIKTKVVYVLYDCISKNKNKIIKHKNVHALLLLLFNQDIAIILAQYNCKVIDEVHGNNSISIYGQDMNSKLIKKLKNIDQRREKRKKNNPEAWVSGQHDKGLWKSTFMTKWN